MTGLLSLAGSTPSEGFELKSVRLDYDSDPRLLKTFTTTGTSLTTGTLSWWQKQSKFGANQCMFCFYRDGSNFDYIGPRADDMYDVYGGTGASNPWLVRTERVFRDPSAWIHFVLSVDTRKDTAADRMKLYINGSEVVYKTGTSMPSQNYEPELFKALNHYIFYRPDNSQNFGGYMAELYVVDGQQLLPSSFAETNEKTNQWQPKEPKDVKAGVTFGTNGYYLPFSNDALATSFTDNSGGYLVPDGVTSVEYLVVAGGGGGSGGGSE